MDRKPFIRCRNVATLFGVLALGTALFGYCGGGWFLRDPHYALKQDVYRVVDAVQLWYIRPPVFGGGGRSFEGLDLRGLDLDGEVDGLAVRTVDGMVTVENLRRYSFDVLAEAPDGLVFRACGLTFDARPVLVESSK